MISDLKELPVGYISNGELYKFVELKKLGTEDLMILGEKKSQSNPYQVFLSLMQKGVVSIQNNSGEELIDLKNKFRFLTFRDSIFIIIELIALTKDEYVNTSYKCPRCQEFTIFDEDDEGNDNRENIHDVKLTILSEDDVGNGMIEYNVDCGFEYDGFSIKSYLIEYPKIKSYIEAYNYTENPFEQEREALYRSLVSVDGCDETELKRYKTKYGRAMFLPDVTEYKNLQNAIRKIGYNIDEHRVKCGNCGNKYVTRFDVTNFFGSILPA